MCYSVPSLGPFVGRCDCWGQPFSSCPCHRALWGMHFSPQDPSRQTSRSNCSRSIYDNLRFPSVLFICAVSFQLAGVYTWHNLFNIVHTLKWSLEQSGGKKAKCIPSLDVSCVTQFILSVRAAHMLKSRRPWAYG